MKRISDYKNYMSKSLVLSFFLTMIFGISAYSQTESSYNSDQHITRLEKGVLLVKLNTQSKKLNYLQKFGQNKKIEKLKKEIEKEHSQIRSAFKKYYSFSKVFFFYSDNAKEIIEDQNWDLLLDSGNDKIDGEQPVYFAYLQKPDWYAQSDAYFFIIHSYEDRQVIRLKRPFPFYRSTKSANLFKRTDYYRSIEKLQKSLVKFKNKERVR